MSSVDGKPTLIVFTSRRQGASRLAVGYLAQVLQRRRNHDTFDVRYVAREERPDLFERFRIDEIPCLVVVEANRIQARLAQPRGCEEIRAFLGPWLRKQASGQGVRVPVSRGSAAASQERSSGEVG